MRLTSFTDYCLRVLICVAARPNTRTTVPAACFEPEVPICAIAKVCRLHGVLEEAVHAFYAVLDRYTLADLVHNGSALRRVLFQGERARIT